MEETKKTNIKIIIFRIISIIIIVICLIVLLLWHKDNSSNSNIQNSLSNLVSIKEISFSDNIDDTSNENITITNQLSTISELNNLEVDFNSLKSKNSETVAWIKIYNTNINFPIVQSSDNSYYLNRNFYREKNSAGWIFADFRNNFKTLDKNTIIYGHNRRNGTMFSNLNYFLNIDWYSDEKNKYFNFATEDQNFIAEIFSVYKVSANNVNLSNTFSSTEELQQNIDSWKNASIYDFKTDVTLEDNLLTLYTCDNNNSYRIIIVSKLIPVE